MSIPKPINGCAALLGLPADFDIRSDVDYEMFRKKYIPAQVQARATGDEAAQKELSQLRMRMQKRWKRLPRRCENPGCRNTCKGTYCRVCEPRSRKGKRPQLIENFLIPKTHRKPLTDTERALLRLHKVGNSVRIHATQNAVRSAAKRLGLIIKVRTPAGENPKSKTALDLHVWRTDGKSETEVNEVIRRRLQAMN